jgi:hypothetical protein
VYEGGDGEAFASVRLLWREWRYTSQPPGKVIRVVAAAVAVSGTPQLEVVTQTHIRYTVYCVGERRRK